jgi:hypothetical protein
VSANSYPEKPAPPPPLQGTARPSEQSIPIPEHPRETPSEAYQTEPVARLSVPEPSPSSINTDVRRRGINPFLTGVTIAIIASIIGFLIVFAYLVVSYLSYPNGQLNPLYLGAGAQQGNRIKIRNLRASA